MDVKAVSLFKPSGIYTCLYLHGVPNYMIVITTNMQGKGLMKTGWLEDKVDVETVSLFKPQNMLYVPVSLGNSRF